MAEDIKVATSSHIDEMVQELTQPEGAETPAAEMPPEKATAEIGETPTLQDEEATAEVRETSTLQVRPRI